MIFDSLHWYLLLWGSGLPFQSLQVCFSRASPSLVTSAWGSGHVSWYHPWVVGLLSGSFWARLCSSSEVEVGVLLSKNIWIGLFASFPVLMQLLHGFHSCLDSPVRLSRWAGLGIILRRSMLGQGSRIGTKVSTACVRQDCAPNSLVIMGHWLCS